MKLLFIFAVLLLCLIHHGHGASGVEPDRVSVMEGDSVTLNTGVQTNQQEKIRWYYNYTRIAQINGDLGKICTDVQCNEGNERFRDRLKLDHQTGSLTITHTRHTDSGEYTLKIISSRFSVTKIFSVSVTDSGSSSAVTAGISAVVVVLLFVTVAVAVIYYRHRKSAQERPNEQTSLDEISTEIVTEKSFHPLENPQTDAAERTSLNQPKTRHTDVP